MSNCLVTGGRGFIGGHVLRALVESGHNGRSYDLVDGQNVLDKEQLYEAVSTADVVFDCSGVLGSAETFAHIERTIDVNIRGTLHILEACASYGVPMVFMSLKAGWHNPYMITKHAGTSLCLMYAEYRGLSVSVVRGMNAYGPGQHWGAVRKVVPTFIMAALANKPLRIFGDGRQIVDLIYADDLAEVMVRIWERDVWGRVIDGGSGVPMTVTRLASHIIDLAGSTSRIEYEPMRPGEPDQSQGYVADPTDMVRLLDYYPTTSVYSGLVETIDWYREHGAEAER